MEEGRRWTEVISSSALDKIPRRKLDQDSSFTKALRFSHPPQYLLPVFSLHVSSLVFSQLKLLIDSLTPPQARVHLGKTSTTKPDFLIRTEFTWVNTVLHSSAGQNSHLWAWVNICRFNGFRYNYLKDFLSFLKVSLTHLMCRFTPIIISGFSWKQQKMQEITMLITFLSLLE